MSRMDYVDNRDEQADLRDNFIAQQERKITLADLLQKCATEFAVIEQLCADKHAYEAGKRISGYQAIAWHCRQARAAIAAREEQEKNK